MIIKIGMFFFDSVNNIYSKDYTNVVEGKGCKSMTKKQFVFLSVLINAGSGNVVEKKDIISRVWQGVTSQESLTQMVNKVRMLFEDREKTILVNHVKVGYSLWYEIVDLSDCNIISDELYENRCSVVAPDCNVKIFSLDTFISKGYLKLLFGILLLVGVFLTIIFVTKNTPDGKPRDWQLGPKIYPGMESKSEDSIIFNIENRECILKRKPNILICN